MNFSKLGVHEKGDSDTVTMPSQAAVTDSESSGTKLYVNQKYRGEAIAQESVTGRFSEIKSLSLVSIGQKAGIQQNQRKTVRSWSGRK